MTTTIIKTKINVQYYGASAIPVNTPGSITRRYWTMDVIPRWIGNSEVPMRHEGEWVGTSSSSEELETFLGELFRKHSARIADGCNYSGTMKHVVEIDDIPDELRDQIIHEIKT